MTNTERLRSIHKFDQLMGFMARLPLPITAMVDVVLDDGVVVQTPRDLLHHPECLEGCQACECHCHG